MKKFNKSKGRVYLDFGATTPVDPKVLKVMTHLLASNPGNPASLHKEGRDARAVLDSTRQSVAKHLSASPSEILFTGGGTESNNLAIKGTVAACSVPMPHIITSTIEHLSVLEPIRELERNGAKVTYLRPNADGIINPKDVRDALRDDTVLVSIMYANNEIGVIQDVKEIAKVIRQYKKTTNKSSYPYFHTDAAQALGYLDMNTQKLGADLISLDSGKVYGPKGVGLLYIKRGVKILSVMQGGGQESGLRSGTENVALIAGFAEALSINEKVKSKESARLTKLRDYFTLKLLNLGANLNGSKVERLPNNVSVCFQGFDAEFAVFALDERGIAASSASTCMNLKEDSYSYVVEEIGKADCKASSLRFTLGRTTSKSDIDNCLQAIKEVLLLQHGASK